MKSSALAVTSSSIVSMRFWLYGRPDGLISGKSLNMGPHHPFVGAEASEASHSLKSAVIPTWPPEARGTGLCRSEPARLPAAAAAKPRGGSSLHGCQLKEPIFRSC